MPPAASDTAPSRLALLLVVGVTLGWGINWPILKIGMSAIPPWTFRAASVPTGGLLILAAAWLSGLSLRIPRDRLTAIVGVSLVNITGWYLLSAIAVSHLTSGRAVLLAFTMPLWATLLGVLWLRERMTWRRLFGVASGLAGVAALMGEDIWRLGEVPIGGAIMLVGAFIWALGTVLLKRVAWNMPVVTLTGWQCVIGGLPLIIGAILLDGGTTIGVTPGALFAVGYNIVVSIALCTYGWYKIVSLLPASATGVSSLMIPVIGVGTGNLLLGEPFGLREAAALVLVLLALGLTLLGGARPAREP